MLTLYLPPPPADDVTQIIQCLKGAAEFYRIEADRVPVLYAMLRQERGSRGVSNERANGTRDQGWWQINSHWNDTLSGYGIDERLLTTDPCLASYTAVWVFDEKLRMAKGDFWKAVGYYRSVNEPYFSNYVRRVREQYREMLSNEGFMRYFHDVPAYHAAIPVGKSDLPDILKLK